MTALATASISAEDSPPITAQAWGRRLAPYREARTVRGLLELATTFLPFAVTWGLMYLGLATGHYWLYALLLLPAAGLLVRLFMIQHDCGHGAFLRRRWSNDWLGRVISIFTMTPYDHWRRSHAIHHASSGNLDRRGIGDIDTLTKAEYLARSPMGRLRYRLYRHPIVMFGIGPAYVFLLETRLPLGFMRKGWQPWVSTMSTNLGIAALAGILIWTLGLVPFLLIQVPTIVLAAAAGVWLFYVQHQFEETHWAAGEDWTLHDAALHGSSHYDLPAILRWFTANIGVHHVHHLASRIPFYRLPEVLRDHPELKEVSRLTLWQSLKCVRLTLWDERAKRLIAFSDLRAQPTAA